MAFEADMTCCPWKVKFHVLSGNQLPRPDRMPRGLVIADNQPTIQALVKTLWGDITDIITA